MNRRTLLAGISGASIAGTAGCYGLAQLITGGTDDENSDENTGSTESDEKAAESPLIDAENDERNGSSESEADEESDRSGETIEDDGTDGSGGRPEDAVETISVTDHGLDISPSPEPGVENEIVCYGTFKVGEYDLRKVRIDAFALNEAGEEVDHGWVPFFTMDAGESYSVEIPFWVTANMIHEYLIGATEAQYVE